MKKNILFFVLFFVSFCREGQGQTINANWPDINWTLSGSYDVNDLQSSPQSTNRFSYIDSNGAQNTIFATSPATDISSFLAQGKTGLKMTIAFVFDYYFGDAIYIQYYNADSGSWATWPGGALYNYFDQNDEGYAYSCNYNHTFITGNLDISNFTPTQLAGFKYRIYYNDSWQGNGGGFCFASPSISGSSCISPSNLTAAPNIYSANLSWTENGSATNWDIELGLQGFSPTGNPTHNNVGNPYTLNNLSQQTSYDYYVRADCSGFHSSWAGPFAFTTLKVYPGAKCTYIFRLSDYQDDGWGGNFMEVKQNGVVIATLNLTNSDPDVKDVPVTIENGVNFELFWNTNGAFSEENNVRIINPLGNSIFYRGFTTYAENPQDQTLYTGTGECDSCRKPTALTVSNISSMTAELGWTEHGSASLWDIEIGPSGFVPTGTPSFSGVGNPYTVGSLTAATEYEFYVRSDCGGGTTSYWTGPFAFTTQPLNNNITNAIPLNMNANCTGDIYTNINATVQTGEPRGTCWSNNNGDQTEHTVWFSFTAPNSGTVIITTDIWPGNLGDSQLAVYSASNPNDFSTFAQIGCDEDSGNIVPTGFMSTEELTGLIPGKTYYIQIDGWIGKEGGFCIEIKSADYVYYNNSWVSSDPSGISTTIDDILVFSGVASLIADTQANNITIQPGATLNIEQVLTVNGNIENNGSLVFVNDAAKLGQLNDMTGSTITGTGSVTVQRYIPARNDQNGAYRYITSAVTTTSNIHANWQEGATSIGDDPNPGYGMFITGSTTGSNGFDATPAGAPSLFTADNTAQAFAAVANTDTNTLVAGQPYLAYVWGDRGVDILTNNVPPATTTTLRARGSLALGPQINTGVFSTVQGHYNFFGNPYQAIVDMGKVVANPGTANLNGNFYYVWDPTIGTRGVFVTVNLSDGSNNTSGASQANRYLQPGQAAFILTGNLGTTASIAFEENDKAVFENPAQVFRPQNTTAISMQLYQAQNFAQGGPLSDALRIEFLPNESNAVLPNDAIKMANMDENLTLLNGTHKLSIERRALPVDGEVLQVSTSQYRTTDYVFQITVNGINNLDVFLHDAYLGIQTRLAGNSTSLVSFAVDGSVPASIAPDRFSIAFVDNLSIDENSAEKEIFCYPNPTDKREFFIVFPNIPLEKVEISLYNVLGQKVYGTTKEMDGKDRIKVTPGILEAGVYLLETKYGKTLHTGKIVFE